MRDAGREASEGGLLRGIVGIVLLGITLGIGFNALGLQAKPARGLAWIGEDRAEAMPTLAELAGEAAGGEVAPPPGGYTQSNDPMAIGVAPAASELPEIPVLDRPIEIDLGSVKTLFDAGHLVVVDAREPDEWAEGRIPGAINLPFDLATAEPQRLEALETAGRPIVVYCGGGACELSLSLAWELIHAGKTKVTVFMGGYPDWVAAGYPTEAGS
jgi:rhodanese-related sulfurtransferase